MTLVPLARSVLESDDSLAELYDQAPCGLMSTTATGLVLRTNQTLQRWLGFSAAELAGGSFDVVLDVGSRLIYQSRCLPALRIQDELREVALDMQGKDGRSLSVLANFAVRPEPDGVVRVIRTAVFDVSSRQAYRRDLVTAGRAAERSERRAEVLRQASTGFGKSGSVTCLANRLVDMATSAFDAAASAVMLLSPDGAQLQLVAGLRPAGPVVALAESGPEAAAMASRTVVTVGDLDEAEAAYPGLADMLAGNRFAAMSVIPLGSDAVALGVLVCFFGRLRHFERDELELGHELAQQAAVALQHIQVETQLSYRAQHDQLTGLANRELLLRELTAAVQDAERRQRPMALLFLDLDGFKPINDEYGHPAGDVVLKTIAQRLQDATRQGDLVCRTGGDEFVIVCANVDSAAAMVVAERIGASVRQPIRDRDFCYGVTGSIGVAVCPPGHQLVNGAEELIAAADAAMYRSKARGKDFATLTICE